MNKMKGATAAGMAVALVLGTCTPSFAAGSSLPVNVEAASTSSGLTAADAIDVNNLADGVYSLPVSLTSASAVDSSTMPVVFLNSEARVYVAGSEKKIVVTLQPASIMGGTYNADGLYFYPDGSFVVDNGILSISAGAGPAAQFLSFIDDPSNKYHHYPVKVMGDLPASTITNGGYAAVTMGSSVMSASQLCLKCDWSGITCVSMDTPEMPVADAADKTVIDEEIAKAQAVQRVDGRELAYQDLQTVLALAQELSENASAAQQDVDSTAKSLHEHVDAYRKTDLQALYSEAVELDQSKYTAATRSELSQQMSAAKSVLDDAEATDASIASAYAVLRDAIDNLELASVDKSALGGKLDEAKTLAQGKKTAQAFESLQSSIADAQLVYDNDAATQQQVNDALVKLTNAVNTFSNSPDRTDNPEQTIDPDLKDGKSYAVPIAVYKTGTYKTDAQQASMAGNYLVEKATISYVNGKYKAGFKTQDKDGATIKRVVYGDERAKAEAVVAADGSTSYVLTLDTLTKPVVTGFTFAANGTMMTQYADLVFETESAEVVNASEDNTSEGEKPSENQSQENPSNGGSDNPAPAAAKKVAMHRLYNPNSGEHFYTASDKERDELVAVGWNSEGEGWYAPEESGTPVYRMYNPVAGEHHYTMDASERDGLVQAGWNYESIGWYSDDGKAVPLYRDYNPNAFANNHNYTADASEHEALVAAGWRAEGLAWYGVSSD